MRNMDRPIGYWIKHLHQLFEGSLDDLLTTQGLTRRHWQVMNVLSKRARSVADLDTELSPFLSEEEPSLLPYVEELREKGWLVRAEPVDLTEEGRRAHAALLDRVSATRAKVTDGISPEEYLSTVDVLTRMSANLGG
ncbi:MarR family winged helix-turn-helix transcriptional regulator [Nonomuraea sp. NPDC049152]|uniref:MarR family winged helix-turn-helix transcriptional regulator n=1 Tax=Nonomuraea sp. NPDC049152 TaxID=3154350 RepID=UPI0033C0AADF